MKKQIAVILVVSVLSISQAFADPFLDDYNLYAESIFGIPQLETITESISYKSDVTIMKSEDAIICGNDPLSVISSACCALRVIDNAGSQLDQYGRILHAYFLNRTQGKETRSTTETGTLIFVSEENELFTIRLVK